MTWLKTTCLTLIAVAGMTGAKAQQTQLSFNDDFSIGSNRWETLFAQYPRGQENSLKLEQGHAVVPNNTIRPTVCVLPQPQCMPPQPVALQFKAGRAFMTVPFMFKPLEKLAPNTEYTLQSVRVAIASNVPEDAVGIGGSPVFPLRFGIASRRPETDPYNQNMLNIPVRNPGRDSLTLGDIGVRSAKTSEPLPFTEKVLELNVFLRPTTFKTDSQGQAWVWLAGLPSNNGAMEFYVRSVEFSIAPAGRNSMPVRPGLHYSAPVSGPQNGNSLRLPF